MQSRNSTEAPAQTKDQLEQKLMSHATWAFCLHMAFFTVAFSDLYLMLTNNKDEDIVKAKPYVQALTGLGSLIALIVVYLNYKTKATLDQLDSLTREQGQTAATGNANNAAATTNTDSVMGTPVNFSQQPSQQQSTDNNAANNAATSDANISDRQQIESKKNM